MASKVVPDIDALLRSLQAPYEPDCGNGLRPSALVPALEHAEAICGHPYLRIGLALFQRGYFWEAHEVWEHLWQPATSGPERQALQGLIQIAAAHLKDRAGLFAARDRLLSKAHAKLTHLDGLGLGITAEDMGLESGQERDRTNRVRS